VVQCVRANDDPSITDPVQLSVMANDDPSIDPASRSESRKVETRESRSSIFFYIDLRSEAIIIDIIHGL
jgi:hypothetical protein